MRFAPLMHLLARRWLWARTGCAAMCLLLASCSGLSPTRNTDWPAKFEQQLDAATRWSGRLSLRISSEPVQSQSAGFELRGSPDVGELNLLSPIGTTLYRLRWFDTGASLEASSADHIQQFASFEQMSVAATGTALPVRELFDWLRGTPTVPQRYGETWRVDLSQHAQGRIVADRSAPAPMVTLRVVLDQP